jgi:AcrR family transcriptional regulator
LQLLHVLRSVAAVHLDGGLRERKKSDTRRAIADAALRLALRRGPAAVTVDDIAADAGVSPRTVFNYFATKEEAILGIDPERRRQLLDHLEARPADEPPLDALRASLRASAGADGGTGAVAWRTRARLAREHPQLQTAYLASFAALEDELTAAIARRVGLDPASDAYPRLVVAMALTAMRVAVDHALARGRTDGDGLTESVDDAFALLAGGLRTP